MWGGESGFLSKLELAAAMAADRGGRMARQRSSVGVYNKHGREGIEHVDRH